MNIGKTVFPVILSIGLGACGGSTGANLNTASAPTSSTSTYNISTGSSSSGTGSADSGTGSSSNSGSTNSTQSAEGLWRGTTSTNRTVTSLITDNGSYWTIYSAAGNSSSTAGVIMGGSSSSNGAFTAIGSRDFDFETGGQYFLTMNGSYTAKSQLSNTLTYDDSPQAIVTLSSSYDGNYDTASSLTTLAGSYVGAGKTTYNSDASTTYNITSTGQISGSRANGCTFTGRATPRPNGKAYSITLNFNSSACVNGTVFTSGYAYFNPTTRQLYSVTRNSSNNDAFVFIGSK